MASAPKDGRAFIYRDTQGTKLLHYANGWRKYKNGLALESVAEFAKWKPWREASAPQWIVGTLENTVEEWQPLDTAPTDGTAIKIRAPMELDAKYDGKRWVAWQPLDNASTDGTTIQVKGAHLRSGEKWQASYKASGWYVWSGDTAPVPLDTRHNVLWKPL